MPWNLEHRNQRRPPQMAASSILGPRRHSRPVVPGSLNLAVRDVLYCRGTLGSLAMLTAIRKASSRVSRLATNCGQFSAMRNVAHGRVSRVPPVQTAMRNCARDEGGPFEIGNQVLVSSHRKLLSSKAMVVSVAESTGQDPVRQG